MKILINYSSHNVSEFPPRRGLEDNISTFFAIIRILRVIFVSFPTAKINYPPIISVDNYTDKITSITDSSFLLSKIRKSLLQIGKFPI